MQNDRNPISEQASVILYLRVIVALAFVFVVGIALVAMLTMRKLDRIVVVVENVNEKLIGRSQAGSAAR